MTALGRQLLRDECCPAGVPMWRLVGKCEQNPNQCLLTSVWVCHPPPSGMQAESLQFCETSVKLLADEVKKTCKAVLMRVLPQDEHERAVKELDNRLSSAVDMLAGGGAGVGLGTGVLCWLEQVAGSAHDWRQVLRGLAGPCCR